jgi:S1-C subfamily serine protease
MRRIAIAVSLIVCGCLPAPCLSAGTAESGVVGLVVTHQQWDPDRPWAKNNPDTRAPSGVVIEGPYILTTAWMVTDATFIQVKKNGRITQATARPFLIDHEINLALLEVDTPGFFTDLQLIALADETPTRGVLRTERWQGRQFESVASRVKRFEVQGAYLSDLEHVFLLAQTDMSGGGWAEPVFDDDGRLVGLTASQNDQQARIIPVEIIAKFLQRAIDPGPYRGFPGFGAYWQFNSNPDLAAYLRQSGKPRGVLIRQVAWGGSACGVLRPRDILLSVDGRTIDAEGFYSHPRLGQVKFTHLLTDEHDVGDTVPIRVLREGRELDLKMTLRPYPDSLTLIPKRHEDAPPSYVVAGGLVLRELDFDYLRSWGNDWAKLAPLHLKTLYYQQREAQRPDRRRIVLLTSILPAPYNVGYEGLSDVVVESINGRPIDSIPDVVDAFDEPAGGFHTVVLAPSSSRREIVLDASRFAEATAEILAHYSIPEAARMPSMALPEGDADCPGDF